MADSHLNNHGTENIKVAFFLNLAFTLIEIVGGILTNSLAIASDAIHDLGDSVSLGLSWYFQHISSKKRDSTFSYGYKRFSLLGAIVNSIILLIGSVFIISKAIPRLIDPQPTHAEGMIYLAILGVIVNGAAVFKLKKGHSMNEKVVALHLMEDVLGWVAVLIGSIIMKFYDLPIIDPILSLLITLYILINIYKNLKKSFQIILQAIPEGVDINSIINKICSLEEVESVHDCHLWTMDGEYNVFTAHVVLCNYKIDINQQEQLKLKIKNLLSEELINHITIEFESAANTPCPQDM